MPLELAALPTLCEIEKHCRQQKPSRAAGLDGIPSELPHFAAPIIAQHLFMSPDVNLTLSKGANLLRSTKEVVAGCNHPSTEGFATVQVQRDPVVIEPGEGGTGLASFETIAFL